MKKILKVEKYYKLLNYHYCTDAINPDKNYRVDLFVDGSIIGETPESIVGKTVECSIYPHEYIASEVKLFGGGDE